MHEGFRAESSSHALDPDARSRAFTAQDTDPLMPVAVQQEPPLEKGHGAVWEIVETLALALFIFIAVRSVVLNFRVDGLSMEPTLDSGEMLLVNRQVYQHFDLNKVLNILPGVDRKGTDIIYPFHPPQRGDIVVLHPPVDQGRPYIKRVIGLPGDRLAIHDGSVWINGQRLVEPYLHGVATSWPGSLGQGEITIPDDYVFVMGDNRNNSTDSRVFGAIKIEAIIGKAWISYWPSDHLDILGPPNYTHEGQ
jgi:signal peptidase I